LSWNQRTFFKKKRLPGWGANPGPLDFLIYFLIFHHFTAEPQRLPWNQRTFIWSNFSTNSQYLPMYGRKCQLFIPSVLGIGKVLF
jgi:hypothetical protein